jgi:hypothetical protein
MNDSPSFLSFVCEDFFSFICTLASVNNVSSLAMDLMIHFLFLPNPKYQPSTPCPSGRDSKGTWRSVENIIIRIRIPTENDKREKVLITHPRVDYRDSTADNCQRSTDNGRRESVCEAWLLRWQGRAQSTHDPHFSVPSIFPSHCPSWYFSRPVGALWFLGLIFFVSRQVHCLSCAWTGVHYRLGIDFLSSKKNCIRMHLLLQWAMARKGEGSTRITMTTNIAASS